MVTSGKPSISVATTTARCLPTACQENYDGRLLLRARAGDETAFSQLVERHSPWLFRRIVHLLRDEYLAHDAMQQVWLRCYLSLDEIRLVSALPAWLARVAHNQCVSDLRRLSSHQFSATSLLGSL